MDKPNYCFCELAPFYALNLLSEAEMAWVEQQVADCPDLADELTDYQLAVTAIPYSLPATSLAPDLKARLFDQLDLDSPEADGRPLQVSRTAWAMRSQQLTWQPHTVPGVTIAILHQDDVKREVVGILKAEPGVQYPLHRHAATEELFMLEGDLVIEDEVFGPEDYIFSRPGTTHAPYTQGGCRFFFRTSMDDEYLEAA